MEWGLNREYIEGRQLAVETGGQTCKFEYLVTAFSRILCVQTKKSEREL